MTASSVVTVGGTTSGEPSYVGDIRWRTAAADAVGYYRLDGRAAAALPVGPRGALTGLGFAAMPNAAGRKMRRKGALGALGGASSVTIAKANLPSITWAGAIAASGAHDHPLTNNRNIRVTAGNLPRARFGGVANGGAQIVISPADNAHGHVLTVSTGGAGTALPLGRKTFAAYAFICLDASIINTWTPFAGDIKHSLLTADHGPGWVLLNGRALTALTATQQVAAATLGMVTNLWDATNVTLKMKGALALTGGADTAAIARANLPNINLTGTVSTSGNTHTHALNNGEVRSKDSAEKSFKPIPFGAGGQPYPPPLDLNMNPGGDHVHNYTVTLNGGGTAINIETPYLSVNTFIWLGA